MKNSLHLLAVLTGFSLLVTSAMAQVPQLISHQGRIAVGAANFDGNGQFKFALVNASGTTTYWSNDGTSTAGSNPTNAVSLTVRKGLYSVLLGDPSLTNMTPIPTSVWTNTDVRLRVWFSDGTNGSQLLSPDQRLAPVGYLADGSVTAAKIAPGTITGDRLSQEYAIFEERMPSGSGPDAGSAGWNARVIGNAPVVVSGSSITSVDGRTFRLQPGVYFVEAECPAVQVSLHQAAIFESTNSTTATLIGSSGQARIDNASGPHYGTSSVWGYITVTGSAKTYQLRHYLSSGAELGRPVASGQLEVYARMHIQKIR